MQVAFRSRTGPAPGLATRPSTPPPTPGSTGGDQSLLGDRSWLALLLNGVSG